MVHLILGGITIIVLILLSVQDIRERMIFSFPVLTLSVAWLVYAVYLYYFRILFLVAALGITFAIFAALRVLSVWGDGDSDAYLLLAAVLLCCVDIKNVQHFMFLQSISIVASLIVALLVGLIESLICKKKLHKHSDIAVIPGIAVVLIGFIVYGSLNRLGVIV